MYNHFHAIKSSFIDSQLFSVIIGALIGIMGSLLIFLLQYFLNKFQKKKNYTHLLYGIKAEDSHLLKVIEEIKGILDRGLSSTKRLNFDFLQSTRFKALEFDEDIEFSEILTNAYRDIDHTNDMLNRLEFIPEMGTSFINNVKASMIGVERSIIKLNEKVDLKIKELTNKK